MKHSAYSSSAAMLIMSVLLVLISVYSPVTVYSQAHLAEVKIGFPLPFIEQTQSIYPPFFPWQTSVRLPLENPTRILLLQLMLNVTMIFGSLSFFVSIFKRMILRMSRQI